MGIWRLVWTGEWDAPGADEMRRQQTNLIVPVGWRHCDMCDSHIAPEVQCDYDWGGNCSAAGFSWVRDIGPPVRNGKGALDA